MPPASLPSRWSAVLAPLDAPSGDGRVIATPAGAPRVRPLPIPLLYQPALAEGHEGAIVVGNADRVWIDGTSDDRPGGAGEGGRRLMAAGTWNLDDPAAREVAEKVRDEWVTGVSVKLDDQTAEPGYVLDGRVHRLNPDELPADFTLPEGARPVRVSADWRLMSATIVAEPAFAESRITVGDATQPVTSQPAAHAPGAGQAQGGGHAAVEAQDHAGHGDHEGPAEDPAGAALEPVEATIEDPGDGTDDGEVELPDVDELAAHLAGGLPEETWAAVASELEEATAEGGESVFAVVGNTSLPVAPRSTAWDGRAARARMATRAKGKDGQIDPAVMAQGFLYRDDTANPRSVGAYKLPFADVIGGKLTIVPRAVFAIAAVLQGGRGGVSIPDAQKQRVKSKVAGLYRKVRGSGGGSSGGSGGGGKKAPPKKTPPWQKPYATEENPATEPATEPAAEPVAAPAAEPAVESGCGCWSLTAAGGAAPPPAAWFTDPHLDGPTPLHVTDEGRVYGHLATWETCHTGYTGSCVTPPRSSSGYAFFHTGAVRTDDGEDLPVGVLVAGTDHAPLEAGHAAAAAHYAHTGAALAAVRAGEDAHGIWVAGALLPDAGDTGVATLRRAPLSGDWRVIGGRQELVAALAVNTPGFPIPRTRTGADDVPHAVVAAGALPPAPDVPGEAGFDWERFAQAVTDRVLAGQEAHRREHRRRMKNAQRRGKRAKARMRAAFTAPALDQRIRTVAASAARDRATHARQRIMRASATTATVDDDDPELAAWAAWAAEHTDAEFNWVEKVGGLPSYIKRISKHLTRKGMSKSHAIATAVNAARKMCRTGDVNFPGVQQVNAGSRAEACAAIADWERKKAQARGS
ncbi:MAG: hypothetical protein J2P26_05440 [Nocardiopsaceae bacterium]|nr:hypothetical protein [Nocardiopsaceae bacterium]